MLLNDLITAAIAQQPVSAEIAVRERSGAWVTGELLGQRASCTQSDDEAIRRLAGKCFSAPWTTIRLVREAGYALWRVEAMPEIAYCWASGLIEFGSTLPKGAIFIAAGPKATLRNVIAARARHGYGRSKGQLLVPGVPEAQAQAAACDAALAWLKWCAEHDGMAGNKGVVFGGRVG